MEIFKATQCRFTRTLYQTPNSQYLYAAHVILACKSNSRITPREYVFLFQDDLNRMKSFAKSVNPFNLECQEEMYGRFISIDVSPPYYKRHLDDIERSADGAPILYYKYSALCLQYYDEDLKDFVSPFRDGVNDKYQRELGKSIIQAQYVGGKFCGPEKINPMPKYLTEELPLSGLLI